MTFTITTPIYYVNDRPHIGHIYSTVVADIVARSARQRGETTLLSTGTDEHAVKVAEAAHAAGRSVSDFAAEHAAAFRAAFARFGVAFDDFIRTSEPRHIDEVTATCRRLLDTRDIYLGNFEGWYDEGQEEYVTDTRAEASGFVGANGKPLVRRSEENYFFRLSRFGPRIAEAIESGELEITPEARRAEVRARLASPLRDVPISRKTEHAWGVPVPGTRDHRVYVWVDALLNYRTVARSAGSLSAWPPGLQLIGKEILWFHAVLWPAILFALADADGVEPSLPRRLHAHSHWTHEGAKISKSLGNAVSESDLLGVVDGDVAVDAVRFFFAARGPHAAADADFSQSELVRVYDADLANGLGNGISRVIGLLDRHFERRIPVVDRRSAWHAQLEAVAANSAAAASAGIDAFDLAAYVGASTALARRINGLIQQTEPWRLVSDGRRSEAAAIIHACLEGLVFAVDLLAPVLVGTVGRLRGALGLDEALRGPRWGQLEDGREVGALPPLFPRAR